MAAAYSLVDVRAAIQNIAQLRTDVDALLTKVAATQAADLAPLVGQLVAGLSSIDQRIKKAEELVAQFEHRSAELAAELRASVPPPPDFTPVVAALQNVAGLLQEVALRTPTDPPGHAVLTQGMADTLTMMRELCTRMDRPMVREGVAQLPSGPVTLRMTETRTR